MLSSPVRHHKALQSEVTQMHRFVPANEMISTKKFIKKKVCYTWLIFKFFSVCKLAPYRKLDNRQPVQELLHHTRHFVMNNSSALTHLNFKTLFSCKNSIHTSVFQAFFFSFSCVHSETTQQQRNV